MLSRKTGYLTYRQPEGEPGRDEAFADKDAIKLERDGYVVLRDVLMPAEIHSLVEEINQVYRDYPADARGVGSRSAEVDEEFRYEMLNRSPLCQTLAGHRRVLAVIEPLLGEDCHVIANTCWRNPPVTNTQLAPGERHGGGYWHIDAGPHVPRPAGVPWPDEIPYPVFAIGAHVYLQDCPLDCGPTGVIARSHTSGQPPPKDRYDDEHLTYNGEGVTALTARAGDVALFVSDVWHRRLPSGAADKGRFFVQYHYGRRDIAQRLRTTAEVNQLSHEAAARVDSDRAAQLVGLHAPRFYDG